jgi:hypothetical protein
MNRLNRYLLPFTSLLILAILLPAEPATAQQEETLYVKIDYFEPLPGMEPDYLELEKEVWKPIHEERLDRGIIRSWTFYQVVAGDEEAGYRFIAVNVFDDFDMIDYFDLPSIMESVFPDKSPDDLMRKTFETRQVVKTEVWRIDGSVLSDGEERVTGNYLTINYFDERDGDEDHVEMELDFWGGIHEQRVARNILDSWAMYTLIYPGGDNRNYTYSTIDYYNTLGDTRVSVGQELARQAHPDLTDEEIQVEFSRTANARSLYKTELWKLIDSVPGD